MAAVFPCWGKAWKMKILQRCSLQSRVFFLTKAGPSTFIAAPSSSLLELFFDIFYPNSLSVSASKPIALPWLRNTPVLQATVKMLIINLDLKKKICKGLQIGRQWNASVLYKQKANKVKNKRQEIRLLSHAFEFWMVLRLWVKDTIDIAACSQGRSHTYLEDCLWFAGKTSLRESSPIG